MITLTKEQAQQIEDVLWTLEQHNKLYYGETHNTVIEANKALSAIRAAIAQEQEPEYKGWYCAHCERGVDGSEVTLHEQHEVCGRVITNDVPPKPVMQEPVISEVFRICDAYESGFGHGAKNDGLNDGSIFADKRQGEAYELGYAEGVNRSKREQAEQEPLVRFCPGCGSIGEVDSKYRDCCPDGIKARLVPSRFAEECQGLFNLAIGNVAPVREPVAEIIGFERTNDMRGVKRIPRIKWNVPLWEDESPLQLGNLYAAPVEPVKQEPVCKTCEALARTVMMDQIGKA